MGEISNLYISIGSKFDSSGFDKVVEAVDETTDKLKNITDGLKIVGGALTAFSVAGALVMKSFADDVIEGEKAYKGFSDTLKRSGAFTQELKQNFENFADSISRVTEFTDEQIISAEGMLLQMGVLPSKLKESTQAAMDLATVMGVDLESATKLLGKGANENVAAFGKLGIQLDKTRVESEGVDYIVGELNKKFKGAAEESAKSYSGQIKILTNQFAELREDLGQYVIPAFIKLVKGATDLVKWFRDTSSVSKAMGMEVLKVSTIVAGLAGGVLLFIGYLPTLVSGLTLAAGAMKVFWAAANPVYAIVTAISLAIAGLVHFVGKYIDAWNDANGAKAKEMKTTEGKIKQIDEEIEALKRSDKKASEVRAGIAQLEEAKQKLIDKEKAHEEQMFKTADQSDKLAATHIENEEEKKKASEARFEYEKEANRLSVEDQIAYYTKQLALTKTNSEEYWQIKSKIYALERETIAGVLEDYAKNSITIAERLKAVFEDTKAALSNSFEQLLQGNITTLGELATLVNDTFVAIKNSIIKQIADAMAEAVIKWVAGHVTMTTVTTTLASVVGILGAALSGVVAVMTTIAPWLLLVASIIGLLASSGKDKAAKDEVEAEKIKDIGWYDWAIENENNKIRDEQNGVATEEQKANLERWFNKKNELLNSGYASGVQSFKGGLAMVGEFGRELVKLPKGSSIYSNSETNAMLAGSAGGMQINITVPPIPSPAYARQMANIMGTEYLRRIKNNRRI